MCYNYFILNHYINNIRILYIMNEIYKINYVKNNKTEKIVVFIGEKNKNIIV